MQKCATINTDKFHNLKKYPKCKNRRKSKKNLKKILKIKCTHKISSEVKKIPKQMFCRNYFKIL